MPPPEPITSRHCPNRCVFFTCKSCNLETHIKHTNIHHKLEDTKDVQIQKMQILTLMNEKWINKICRAQSCFLECRPHGRWLTVATWAPIEWLMQAKFNHINWQKTWNCIFYLFSSNFKLISHKTKLTKKICEPKITQVQYQLIVPNKIRNIGFVW